MFGKVFGSEEACDENYDILARTTFAPDSTSSITWRHEGNRAVGSFESLIHAMCFFKDHLNAERDPTRPCAFRDGIDPANSVTLLAKPENLGTVKPSISFDAASTTYPLAEVTPSNHRFEAVIDLAALDTAALRDIVNAEPENHNTIKANDEKYALLSTIAWSGVCTDRIQWRRDGQDAVGTFGYCEDASGFIFGYLKSGILQKNCFLEIETEDSREQRGRIREKFLRKDDMADLIQMPERRPWNVPVEVKIPLRFLDINGLKERHTIHAWPGEVREVSEKTSPHSLRHSLLQGPSLKS